MIKGKIKRRNQLESRWFSVGIVAGGAYSIDNHDLNQWAHSNLNWTFQNCELWNFLFLRKRRYHASGLTIADANLADLHLRTNTCGWYIRGKGCGCHILFVVRGFTKIVQFFTFLNNKISPNLAFFKPKIIHFLIIFSI
jgi:hypothetical protein